MAEIGDMGQPLADPVGGGLATRIGSALVLAPLVLFLVYAGPPYFTVLVLVTALAMSSEWVRLCMPGRVAVPMIGVGLTAGLAVVLAGVGQFGWALAAVVGGAGAVLTLLFALGRRGMAVWMAAGAVYVALPCVALVWLRGSDVPGRDAMFWLLAVVWGMDIGAYAVGRTFGGPKLAPRISPKKTWSGLIGGTICSALAATAVAMALDAAMGDTVVLAAGAAVLGVLSQGGDLLESAIKRHFGAKDAGQLIPGHGGVLDRVDGLVVAALAMSAYCLATGGGPAS